MKKTNKKTITQLYAPTPVPMKMVRTTIRVPKPVIHLLKKVLAIKRRKAGNKKMSMSKLMVQSFTQFIDRQ